MKNLQKENDLITDLSQVEKISIHRQILYFPSESIEIHGFSDASEATYCAIIYIRFGDKADNYFIFILIAKSKKVAPIQTISLPRLELSGTVLVANQVNYVISSLKLNVDELNLWRDSSIVLGWLSKLM